MELLAGGRAKELARKKGYYRVDTRIHRK